jgi:hypothetical protein
VGKMLIESLKEGGILEDLGADERIILKCFEKL